MLANFSVSQMNRGCFAAWCAITIPVSFMYGIDALQLYGTLESAVFFVGFTAFIAVVLAFPSTVLAYLVRGALAVANVQARIWHPILVCAGIGATIGALIANLETALIMGAFGAWTGVAFWLGAAGLRWSVDPER